MTRLGEDIRELLHGHGEHVAGAHPFLPGVDVSSFQGPPAAWRVQAGAIEWAAVKLTEVQADGSVYLNPDAAADWAWLRQNGKGRVAYCYGHPAASPDATAAALTNQLREVGCDDGDAIALDLEVTDGRSPAQVSDWAHTVLSLLQRDWQRPPVLYSYLSFIDSGNCATLGAFPLYIADPSSPPGHPRVPAPWTRWALHQTAITGPIDRDVAAFGSLAEMRAALGKKAPAPQHRGYVTTGRESLVEVAAEHKTQVSVVIRLTLEADGHFPADIAGYLDGANLKAPLPKGAVLHVPA